MGSTSADEIRLAVEAAVWAPSVHNTRPWWFDGFDSPEHGRVDRRISLHADVGRRLDVADPDGREMLISCGAALFTIRVAVRHLGHQPEVTVLPDPDRPDLVADVRFGRRVPDSEENHRLYRQIWRRRTHRGPFVPDPLPVSLLSVLRREAKREGAELRIVADDLTRTTLAALTEAADRMRRSVPAYAAEIARWTSRPDAIRLDGADLGKPRPGVATGIVALLTTRDDRPADWLRAGQALQRLLLRATADEVSAAFHTQALEVSELREFIRVRFSDGAYPQVLLRIGLTPHA